MGRSVWGVVKIFHHAPNATPYSPICLPPLTYFLKCGLLHRPFSRRGRRWKLFFRSIQRKEGSHVMRHSSTLPMLVAFAVMSPQGQPQTSVSDNDQTSPISQSREITYKGPKIANPDPDTECFPVVVEALTDVSEQERNVVSERAMRFTVRFENGIAEFFRRTRRPIDIRSIMSLLYQTGNQPQEAFSQIAEKFPDAVSEIASDSAFYTQNRLTLAGTAALINAHKRLIIETETHPIVLAFFKRLTPEVRKALNRQRARVSRIDDQAA